MVVEDSIDEEGEEMVDDDAKKGSIPKYDWSTKPNLKSQNCIEHDEGIRGGRSERRQVEAK